jgi:hypothetical protein
MKSMLSETVDFMVLVDLTVCDDGFERIVIPLTNSLIQESDALNKGVQKIDAWLMEHEHIDPSRMHTFVSTAHYQEKCKMLRDTPRWWDDQTIAQQLENIWREKE